MHAKISTLISARPDMLFSDLKAVLTGETNVNNLSVGCNKPVSYIVGATEFPSSWIYEATGFYDAYDRSSSLGVGYNFGLIWVGGTINKWLACGASGIKSSPDGKIWTSVSNTQTRTLGFNGTTIVAMPTTATTALYSTDGVNWLSATGNLSAPSTSVCAVACLPNGIFVYVDGATQNAAYISTTGQSWSSISMPAGTYYGICTAGTGTGIKFVAVGTNVCATSSTGLSSSWASVSIPSGAYYAVCYNALDNVCLAVGSSVTALSNSTFSAWTAKSAINANQVIHNSDSYIASYNFSNQTNNRYLFISKTATVWSQRYMTCGGTACLAYGGNVGGLDSATGFLMTDSAYFNTGSYYSICQSLKVDKDKTNGVFKLLVDGTHYCPIHIDITQYYNYQSANPSNGYISEPRIGEIAMKVYEAWSAGTGLNLCNDSDHFRYKQRIDTANICALYIFSDSKGLRLLSFLQQDNVWGYCNYNDGTTVTNSGLSAVEIYTRDDAWNASGTYPTWGFWRGRFPFELQVPRLKYNLLSDSLNVVMTITTPLGSTSSRQTIDSEKNPVDFIQRMRCYYNGPYQVLGGLLSENFKFGRDSMLSYADTLTEKQVGVNAVKLWFICPADLQTANRMVLFTKTS